MQVREHLKQIATQLSTPDFFSFLVLGCLLIFASEFDNQEK